LGDRSPSGVQKVWAKAPPPRKPEMAVENKAKIISNEMPIHFQPKE